MPHRLRLALVVVLASTGLQCASLLQTPNALNVVPADFMEGLGYDSLRVSQPLTGRQNGTRVLSAFLTQARDRGATLVTDLSITFAEADSAGYQVCTERILPLAQRVLLPSEAPPPEATPAAPDSSATDGGVAQSTGEGNRRTEVVSTPLCRMVPVTTTQMVPVMTTMPGPNGTPRLVTTMQPRSSTRMQSDCSGRSTSHYTAAYDVERRLQFAPPDLAALGAQFSRGGLYSEAPACRRAPDGVVPEAPIVVSGLLHTRPAAPAAADSTGTP